MKELITAACLALGLTVAAVQAGTHPNCFVNQNEIEAIKAKVAAGQEPWKSAYSAMLSKANSALSQAPMSVTFTGSSSHDYYVQRPYDWSNNMPSPCGATYCDGQINPEADREDYATVTKFSGVIRDLGLGYAFTGDSKYAEKAISLINVFCLDAATYMTPKLGPNGIEHYITFPGLFYGADLIYNYSGWNASDKSAFLSWCTDFGNNVVGRHYSNNWEDWRQVFMASCGVLTENQSFLDNAFNHFKADLSAHIGPSGEMSKELSRTKSLSYSTYALVAMTEVAEIARHQGIDLYGYTVGTDNLEKAWDYHVPYVLNPSTWPREQISAYKGENCALYEMANMVKPKSTYMQVINKYKRPMWESRVMGYTSLTHAAGLDAKPVVATPSISPNGGSHVGAVQVSITTATSGASIHYTTDGSTPTQSSTEYSGPITLATSKTIKAKGFKSGIDASGVAAASFTVTKDQAAPQIMGVSTAGDPTKVVISFDENLDNATATNKANYSIPGLTISSAALSGKTVTLTVSTMTEGTEYTLTVSGIKDLAANPTTMGSTSVKFTYNESYVDDFDSKRLTWTNTTGSRWTVATDGSDKSYHLNTSSYSNDGDKPGEMALVSGLSLGDFELSVAGKSPSSEDGNANRDYGVVFGYEDADNFWYLLANGTADNNQLFQVVNGSRSEKLNLGSALITDSDYHTLKVVLQSGNVSIYQDNVKQGEVAASVADGKVGLCSYNDEAWFDDFIVTPLDNGGTTGIMPAVTALRVPGSPGDYLLYSVTGKKISGNRPGKGVYFRVSDNRVEPVVMIK